MVLSTNEILQQSHKILINLVGFYDVYSQKLSPGPKINHPLTFCYSLLLEFHLLSCSCIWNVGSEAILHINKYVFHA